MPRKASKSTPTITGDVLRTGDQPIVATVGSSAWFAWLAGAQTFYYDGQPGTFTARSEQRRRSNYWSYFLIGKAYA